MALKAPSQGHPWLASVLLLTGWLLALQVMAEAIEVRRFESAVTEQRYQSLTATLRCPKCENQAIGDSNSPIAADMRDKVYEQLNDGRSDKEIIDFMVQRFGDYVLYNPRLEGRTLLLWGLPGALVVVGGLALWAIIRSRRRVSVRQLSAEEQARLDELIDRERRS
ncbi:cytochrome c-type biogenesis protein CcmH [Halomonas denitrificans]|uniref:cytochrome c-type biogenesis protein n=1 Tax=Halomonas TaxID=2745 RepID=UPI001C98B178|nr:MULTISPECIES: cytochrome c-type biogenesis protein [Halomonas]MBY5927884.1 cytochrome c-type biogenesis protein CcmH [Halomonas sp. DP8Y7-3]MBY5967565.1 cytochrome c-type biogenesis protein CcmH [Halomonas denitrificans]MBY6028929.1 cytochrome c-type biogenesis protein CcmH [Halomonas sp. DP8Y7-1]MCA0976047.1 cytochrome c-type biogenesis protein CcmH [Halomonas denitrificans]